MSAADLDRYLTDERVDAATRALRRPLTPHRAYGYGDFEDAALASLSAVLPDIIRQAKAEALDERAVKLAETSIHTSHATGQALSRCVDLVEHIAKDEVIREAKAEALREAAQKYQWGGWAERNPAVHANLATRRRQAEHAVAWLRARADQIEQGARP